MLDTRAVKGASVVGMEREGNVQLRTYIPCRLNLYKAIFRILGILVRVRMVLPCQLAEYFRQGD